MATFNFHDSKVDQFSNQGNNFKLTTKEGDVIAADHGNATKIEGTDNKVEAGIKTDGILAKLWKIVVGWFMGT